MNFRCISCKKKKCNFTFILVAYIYRYIRVLKGSKKLVFYTINNIEKKRTLFNCICHSTRSCFVIKIKLQNKIPTDDKLLRGKGTTVQGKRDLSEKYSTRPFFTLYIYLTYKYKYIRVYNVYIIALRQTKAVKCIYIKKKHYTREVFR